MNGNNIKLLRKKYSRESMELDKKLLKFPLKETSEDLIYLPDLLNKNKHLFYIKEIKTAYLRKSVANQLVRVVEYFNNKGYIVRVESAYRKLDDQKRRFKLMFNQMKKKYPKLDNNKLLVMTNTYTAGIPILGAHTAGAGVDITLADLNGRLLDFGVPCPHGDIESITNYPYSFKTVKNNRKLLKNGMEKFGFVNYPFEYWHYSIDDVFAAYLSGKKYAKFGPIDFDYKTHKLKVITDTKKLYSYFDVIF